MTTTATIESTTVTVIPGTSVNITNNKVARDAVTRIKELKALEAAGAAAERERKALEAEVLEPIFGTAETLVILGQNVVKRSSERTTHLYDTKTLEGAWPEAYTAIHSVKKYRFNTYA